MNNTSEMGRMKFSMACFALIGIFLCPCLSAFGQADMRKGAVFIIGKEGSPSFLGIDGKELPATEVEKDDSLPEGATVVTGPKDKVVLLFSNGTVTTVEADSKLKVKVFLQEAFDAKGRKMSDLLEEPSESKLELELDTGSLVVGTKSLQKTSRMLVTTPTGTAGIRGTQFQLNQKPNGALALDVTESTVAFTPKGAAKPTMVNTNRGLDVAVGGILAPRPINPVVAQRVINANAGAFAMSEEVKLSEVSAKMEETTPADSKEGDDSEGGDGEGEGGDGDAESGDGDAESGDGDAESGDGDAESGDTDAESGDGDAESGGGDAESGDGGADSDGAGSEATSGGESQPASENTGGPAMTAQPAGGVEVDQSQVVENNPETKMIRKLGVLDERTDRMLDMAFSEEQMIRFLAYPANLQELLLNETPEVVQRLMDIKPTAGSLQVFYSYDPALSRRLLQLNDNLALGNLFQEQFDEDFANALITADNLKLLNQSQTASPSSLSEPSDANLFDSATTLLEKTKANGNQFILTDLIERGGGALTSELILSGLEGDSLLTDVAFEGQLLEDRLFLGEQVMSNPYYQDVSSTLDEAASFLGYASGFQFQAYSGRNVSIYGGVYDLSQSWAEGAQAAVISASDSLVLQGSITFSTWTPEPTLVLMSGNEFSIQSATTVSYPTGNLSLLSGGDLSVDGATLVSGNELSLKSYQNLNVTNSTLDAKQARLEAASKLNLDTVGFGSKLSTLYLQATTVNLSNVNFPSGSLIHLNSLKGAIDSKYPNFGNELRGRVNFIKDVKYGGNLMHDRPSFDLHGNNVTIGKIPGQ